MIQILQKEDLATSTMIRVFDNTSVTYKFYRLLSLLDMHVVLQYVKQKIDNRYHLDGYNVGINVGEAASQSVFHCHMHLIPRYKGNVTNPKGGVRGVILSKQKY